jgi:hypothetical protein
LLIMGFDRLRVSIEAGRESDIRARLVNCGMRYREFALANAHFYKIMFGGVIKREQGPHDSDVVEEHARAAFAALVRLVELAAAAGVVAAPDPVEVAQQIWSAVHGAVSLELDGLVLTPYPEATYAAFIETVVRGLAPHQPPPGQAAQGA